MIKPVVPINHCGLQLIHLLRYEKEMGHVLIYNMADLLKRELYVFLNVRVGFF